MTTQAKQKLHILSKDGTFPPNIVETLSSKSIDVKVFVSVEECLQAVMSTKPEFVMLDFDHYRPDSVQKLGLMLQDKLGVATIAFVSTTKISSAMRLEGAKIKFRLSPPISFDYIYRMLSQIVKKNPELIRNRVIDLIPSASQQRQSTTESLSDSPNKSLNIREPSRPRQKNGSHKNNFQVLQGCVDAAVADTFEQAPGLEVLKITSSKTLNILPFVSSSHQGYFSVATALPAEQSLINDYLLKKMCTYLERQLRAKEISVTWDERFKLELANLDFVEVSQKTADINKLFVHGDEEGLISFFESPGLSEVFKLQVQGDHYAIAKDEFFIGDLLTFPVFLKLQMNEKFLQFGHANDILSLEQSEKLADKNYTHVYIKKSDIALFTKYRAAGLIRRHIENFLLTSSNLLS